MKEKIGLYNKLSNLFVELFSFACVEEGRSRMRVPKIYYIDICLK